MKDGLFTRRELIEAQREAFARGARFQFDHWSEFRKQTTAVNHISDQAVREGAQRLYPLTTTRPRVVRDSEGVQWRLNSDGRLEFKTTSEWHVMLEESCPSGFYGTALKPNGNRCKIWAGLYEQPTETVDDE